VDRIIPHTSLLLELLAEMSIGTLLHGVVKASARIVVRLISIGGWSLAIPEPDVKFVFIEGV